MNEILDKIIAAAGKPASFLALDSRYFRENLSLLEKGSKAKNQTVSGKHSEPVKQIHVFDLGRISFGECHQLQDSLQKLRIENKIDDIFLIVEHPPVYTITKHTKTENLLFSEQVLKEQGIELEKVDRGGDVTFHGPGQIVGYPIIDIRNYNMNVRLYVNFLQNLLIETLNCFNIKGYIDKNAPGVWVNSRKIAALGVRITRFVTKHGFALNNNTDLAYYNGIIPCGLRGKEVTSIKSEQNMTIPRNVIINKIISITKKSLKIDKISVYSDNW